MAAGAALASGVLELLTCVITLIYRYLLFGSNRLFGPANVTMKAAESGGETAVMGSGIFLLLEYLIQPVTLLLIYFAIEGLARALAALVSDEVIPTLPMQSLAWLQGAGERRYAEHAAGPRVVDVVQSVKSELPELTILSCRPKSDWNQLTTISYEGELYELSRQETGLPPRRFVYMLRKKPEGKVVRGIYHYDPGEALQKKS